METGQGSTAAVGAGVGGTGLSRRSLVKGIGGVGLALPLLGGLGLGAADAADDPHAGGQPMDMEPNGPVKPFTLYDPVLKPVQAGTKHFTLTAGDATLYVAQGVPMAAWTFDGTIPGRTLRVVEGDTVNVTVRVDPKATTAHSVDFHSAKTAPDKNYKTVLPGKEYAWSFVAQRPGAYMYHCGTAPALMHIGAGMYGAMIVDPKAGWSRAQELIFVQSEFYLKDGEHGIKVVDYAKMMGSGHDMDYCAFNGYANQYVEHPIKVEVKTPIRIFVVNAGPNVWTSFHIVGTIFDRVLVNGSPKNQLFDLQSVSIGPGDAACVEFTLDEPGTYAAVNHSFGHASHGAVALLQAS